MIQIKGVIVKGMGGANISIRMQKPIFKSKGLLNVDNIFDGTLNVKLSQHRFEIIKFDHMFQKVKWHPTEFPEDFGFIKIENINHRKISYHFPGYIYIPGNSPHRSNYRQFEVISQKIDNVNNGDLIDILIDNDRLRLIKI